MSNTKSNERKGEKMTNEQTISRDISTLIESIKYNTTAPHLAGTKIGATALIQNARKLMELARELKSAVK